MIEVYSTNKSGLLVGGTMLLWMLALMGAFQSETIITTSRPAATTPALVSRADDEQQRPAQGAKSEDVTELVIKSAKRRPAKPTIDVAPLVPTQPSNLSNHVEERQQDSEPARVGASAREDRRALVRSRHPMRARADRRADCTGQRCADLRKRGRQKGRDGAPRGSV